MSTKKYGLILAAIFLLELTDARTVSHHEIIIKSNGDKIERSWTTQEGDGTELNNENNLPPNVFEDGKDGADENIFVNAPLFKNFALPIPVFDKGYSELRPGYNRVEPNLKVPQKKSSPGMKSGQFEEAWDLEPDFMSKTDMEPESVPEQESEPEPEPEIEPEPEAEPGWKSVLDLAKQPNSLWKPIDSQTYVENNYITPTKNEPWPNKVFSHTYQSNGFESWPTVAQQQPTEPEKPLNINGVHVTQTFSSQPTQFISTDSYSGPRTIITNSLPDFYGWTSFNENPQEISWQDVLRGSIDVGEDRNTQKAKGNNSPIPSVAVKPAKYPAQSLDELLDALYGGTTTTTKPTTTTAKPTTTTTPRTTTTSTTTKPKHKPITIINIQDLPIADILNNGQPIDDYYLKTLPEHLRPVDEDTLYEIRGSHHIQNIPMTRESDIGNIPPSPKIYTPLPPPPPPSTPYLPPFNVASKPQAAHHHHQSNIAKFLSRVDLSKDDILFKTGGRTVTKTIVDDNGDILTATFMLSSVVDREADSKKAQIEVKPIK